MEIAEGRTVLLKAVQVAVLAHHGQTRKKSDDPYIIHPLRVASILSEIELPPSVDRDRCILAAVLHDVLEDCPERYSSEQMEKDFGKEVAKLVGELTLNMSIPAPDRRQLMLEKCAQMSLEAKIIKLADRLDNMRDNMGSLGEAFISRYCAEAEVMLEKMRGACPFLEEELRKMIRKYKF